MADKAESAAKHHPETDSVSMLAKKVVDKADVLKYVIIGLAVILVLSIAVFSYMRRSSASREAEAENKLFMTLVNMSASPETEDAAPVFDRLAREYAGLPAGARALVVKFVHTFNKKDYAAAEAALRDFLKGYPNHELAPRARLALGQTLVFADKLPEAVGILRDIAYSDNVGLMPEAKLALAQALEREAEAARDDPEEYRRRLEIAAAEYNDIVVRSRITVSSQRGFWSPTIVIPADFALVAIKDRLAGYTHETPASLQVGADANAPVMATPPPADEEPAEGGQEASE